MSYLRPVPLSPDHWLVNYNTPLSEDNEAQFQDWMALQSGLRGRDMQGDLNDYDLRGYWLMHPAAKDDILGEGHLTDTYKKPNHPTFSTDSIYHGKPDPYGGTFQAGTWAGDDQTGWAYQPSARMLQFTHSMPDLQQYFADFEPDSALVSPLITSNIRGGRP